MGNLIAATANGILASSDFSADAKKRIRQALDAKLRPADIAGMPQVGQLVVPCGSAGLICAGASDDEIAYAEDCLGIQLYRCTVNMGGMHLRSGIIANSRGMLIGSLTTPVEAQQMHEAMSAEAGMPQGKGIPGDRNAEA
jgi:translation initiation factor 6